MRTLLIVLLLLLPSCDGVTAERRDAVATLRRLAVDAGVHPVDEAQVRATAHGLSIAELAQVAEIDRLRREERARYYEAAAKSGGTVAGFWGGQ